MNVKDVLKLVSGSCAVYFIMAACSAGSGRAPFAADDGGTSGSGSGGSGGGDGSGSILDAFTDPTPSASADPTQSGTRLKVQYYVGADGSKQAAGMFDSQLNVQCYFGKASDGKTRCLPVPAAQPPLVTIYTGSYFADANCSQPLGTTIGPCPGTPNVIVVSTTNNSTCTTTTTSYQAGPQFTAPLYQGPPSACSAVDPAYQATLVSEGWKFYSLGPQIQPPDPTQYVEATLQTEP
jgi:hypothetical protein